MAKLDAKARAALDDSDFAYIDAKGDRHLPINDEGHVRSALARLDQQQDADGHLLSDAVKAKVRAKITVAAQKFGIDISKAATEVPFLLAETTPDFALDEAGALVFDDPDTSDVYVPTTIGNPKAFGKNLVQRLKAHLAKKPYLSADDVDKHIRAAAGHAGGSAKSAAEGDGGEWEICPACQAAGQGAADGCVCPSCTEGDPDDCLCTVAFEEDATEKGMSDQTVILSDSGERVRLFVPVECADAPEWVPYLPKPGTYDTMKYGKLTLTPDKYDRMLQNFHQGTFGQHLPVTLEHADLSGAAGYLRDMRRNCDGSLDVKVEWNDLGKGMLADNRYKYASAEFYDDWKNNLTGQWVKDVPKGHTLTKFPMFKEGALRPVIASEGRLQVIEDGSSAVPPHSPNSNGSRSDFMPENKTTEPDVAELQRQLTEQQTRAADAKTKAEAAKTASEVAGIKPDDKRLATAELTAHEATRELAEMKATGLEADIKALTEKAAADKKAADEAAKKAAEGQSSEEKRFAEMETENKAMTERLAVLEADKRRSEFAETARTFTEGASAVSTAVSFMERLPSDELRAEWVTQQKAAAEQLKQSGLFSSRGVPGTEDATNDMRTAIKQYTEAGMSYADAYKKVAIENPQLVRSNA